MLIFREFFNTQSDQNILQNTPNCTTFSKISQEISGFLRIKHYGKHIIVVSRSLRIHLHLAHLKLNTIFVQQNNLIFNVTIH